MEQGLRGSPPATGCILAALILSSKPSTWQLIGRLSKIYRRLGRNPASQRVSWQKQKNWQISICETYPFLSQPGALFSQQTPHPSGKEQPLPVSEDTILAAQPKGVLNKQSLYPIHCSLLTPLSFQRCYPFVTGDNFPRSQTYKMIAVSCKWAHLQR